MNDQKDFEKLGFNISNENIQKLIVYVASQKLKGVSCTRSGVVNEALSRMFASENVVVNGEVA